jgi:hypothetical protein
MKSSQTFCQGMRHDHQARRRFRLHPGCRTDWAWLWVLGLLDLSGGGGVAIVSEHLNNWYTAEDYEIDLNAVLSTVADLEDGHRKFPGVSARFSSQLTYAGERLLKLAGSNE